MALVRNVIEVEHPSGYSTETDLNWSVSHKDGIKLFHIYSKGDVNRPDQKVSQVYTFKADEARQLAAILHEHFPA